MFGHGLPSRPRCRRAAIPKRRLCIAARCIDCPAQEGFSLSDTSANALAASGHRPMGFPEFVIVIASIMALNPIAMDMMLPALPNIASAFHITVANRPQMVLSIFLLGFGVGQFMMGPLSDRFGRRADSARRHGALLRRQPACDRGAFLRDAAAGARAAGPRHLGHPRHRHRDRSRLLRRPAHGERGVAGDDGVHRRARRRPLVRAGRAAADALARHLHRADAVWRGGVRLERAAHAGDVAGRAAQIACDRRGARRLPADRHQPPDARLCARRRRRAGLAVRLRVFVAADLHRGLPARALFPAGVRGLRCRRRHRRLRQCPLRRPARHARDFARRADRLCRRFRRHAGGGANRNPRLCRCSWRCRR